jgi:hypothetical protein
MAKSVRAIVLGILAFILIMIGATLALNHIEGYGWFLFGGILTIIGLIIVNMENEFKKEYNKETIHSIFETIDVVPTVGVIPGKFEPIFSVCQLFESGTQIRADYLIRNKKIYILREERKVVNLD